MCYPRVPVGFLKKIPAHLVQPCGVISEELYFIKQLKCWAFFVLYSRKRYYRQSLIILNLALACQTKCMQKQTLLWFHLGFPAMKENSFAKKNVSANITHFVRLRKLRKFLHFFAKLSSLATLIFYPQSWDRGEGYISHNQTLWIKENFIDDQVLSREN